MVSPSALVTKCCILDPHTGRRALWVPKRLGLEVRVMLIGSLSVHCFIRNAGLWNKACMFLEARSFALYCLYFPMCAASNSEVSAV